MKIAATDRKTWLDHKKILFSEQKYENEKVGTVTTVSDYNQSGRNIGSRSHFSSLDKNTVALSG